jgi:nitroreductase
LPPPSRISLVGTPTTFRSDINLCKVSKAAWDLGIGSCPPSISEPEKAREILEVPQKLFPRITISFSYPHDPDILTYRPYKRGQKPFFEIALCDNGNFLVATFSPVERKFN